MFPNKPKNYRCFMCLLEPGPKDTFHFIENALSPVSKEPLKNLLENLAASAKLFIQLSKETQLCIQCCREVIYYDAKRFNLLATLQKAIRQLNTDLEEEACVVVKLEDMSDPLPVYNEIDPSVLESKSENDVLEEEMQSLDVVKDENISDPLPIDNEINTTSVEDIANHSEKNKLNLDFMCEICDFSHHNKSHFILHMNKHRGLKDNQCPFCHRLFNYKDSCIPHIEALHPQSYKAWSVNNYERSEQNTGIAAKRIRYELPGGKGIESNVMEEEMRALDVVKDENISDPLPINNEINTIVVKDIANHSGENKQNLDFICEICDFSHHNKIHFILHVNKHRGLKANQCPWCHKLFNQKYSCIRHIEALHQQCYESWSFKNYGKNEENTIVIEEKRIFNEIKAAICDICKISFRNKEELDEHVDEMHKDLKKYKCDLCEFAHANEYHIILHKNTHQGMDEKECPWCHKLFPRKKSCIRHIERHIDQQKYQCDKCGLSFSTGGKFKNHKMIHDAEENPLCCSICKQKFKTIKTFKYHEMTHRQDRPRYTCKHCGKIFVDRYAYTQHNRRHLQEIPEKQDKKNTSKNQNLLKCIICNDSFINKEQLEKHMESNHDVILKPLPPVTLP